jgi:hypothetical protein
MRKATFLNIILILTFIELLTSIILPFFVIKNGMGLGAVIFGALFIVLIIYFLIYLIFLTRYVKREEVSQSIPLVIFLNILPFISLGFLWIWG